MKPVATVPATLARIVTIHHQWNDVRAWLDNPGLHAPGIAWLLVNDAPGDPAPPDLAAVAAHRGVRILAPPCNLGRCGARNLGAAETDAAWVEHIDGDDAPLPFSLETLRQPEGCGVVLFPVAERTSPDPAAPVTVPAWDVAASCYWSFVAPAWHPLDPRPAGTVWRRGVFLALGGYDGRFNGSEDVHLVWKAAQAGVVCAHATAPKQSYFLHAGTDFRRNPQYRYSLEAFLHIHRHASEPLRSQMELLLGRQLVLAAGRSWGDLWRHRRTVGRFLKAKLTGRFRTFNSLRTG